MPGSTLHLAREYSHAARAALNVVAPRSNDRFHVGEHRKRRTRPMIPPSPSAANPETPPGAPLLPNPAGRAEGGWQRWLPGLRVLRQYQRAWFRPDLVPGLVLTSMLVPVGIAYAEASGVSGICGLYATIVPLQIGRASCRERV